MRAVVSCALALLAVAVLSAAPPGRPHRSAWVGSAPARLAYCATKADKASIAAHSKTNSFAPHPSSHGRVYGAPIQSRILKRSAKKKPQLTSSPLPDSTNANTPSGG